MQKKVYLADWILPVSSPPIPFGGIAVENGRILQVADTTTLLKNFPRFPVENFGAAVIAPSWVNAHCHLELSAFAGMITGFDDFPDWIRQLIALRGKTKPEDLLEPALKAARELAASGCVLTGDITNGDFLAPDLFSGLLERVIFYEILGFDASRTGTILMEAQAKRDAENPVAQIVPHAPYSTSAPLIQKLAKTSSPMSIHLAESVQESEFLLWGSGSFKEFLQERGVWDEQWRPPGKSPVAYLSDLDCLGNDKLLVHGVQVNQQDLVRLKESGASVCVCARSNTQTGVGEMPVMEYLTNEIPLCVGTDSLAGNIDLDMNNEIYYIYNKNSQIDPAELIRMATLNGAEVLGQSANYGALKAGLKSRFNVFSAYKRIEKEPERFIVSKSWSSLQCF